MLAKPLAGPRPDVAAPLPAWHRPLEILGLWTLSLLEPLLALLGGGAPFLLHHRIDGLDLAVWCILLALGPVLLLWGLERLLGTTLGESVARRFHGATLGVLAVVLLLGMARRSGDPLPAWALLPLAGGAFWAAARAARRGLALRRFCALLALALPLVLFLFWHSEAAGAIGASAAGAAAGRSAASFEGVASGSGTTEAAVPAPTPVIVVVFDELPLLSVLDAELGIDRSLCPNLARFAESATWFRNASTVWSLTNQSIASLLTGRTVDRSTPPTRQSHPGNLLTWLAATHRVAAFELTTSMAPATAVESEPPPPRTVRLAALSADTAVIAAHLVTPPELEHLLPAIGNRWGGFWRGRVVRGRSAAGTETAIERSPWAFALADGRGRDFASFVDSIEAPSAEEDRPSVHFAHVMLPHMPYRYLPSGRVYGGRPIYDDPAESWRRGGWFALETYQRHMLQVGFVDRLIGDLMRRLEEQGLWERALVVLTADHGVSHWPGEDRRRPDGTDHPEDIWRVPLLIKAPGQVVGRIDERPALSVDVVPTIAALLGTTVPWEVEGVTLVGEAPAARVPEVRSDDTEERRVVTSTSGGYGPGLERKLELFDPRAGELRWVALGPYRHLVGRRLEELSGLSRSEAAADCRAVLDQQPVVTSYDPGARYSPAWLTGGVECDSAIPPDSFVLAAVNGLVAGSGEVVAGRRDRGEFSVMTAEAVWTPGSNRIDFLLASGAPDQVRLEAIELP